MAIFYHVSPTRISVGEYIGLTCEASGWRKEEDGVEAYACLAPNRENAIFWVRALEWSFRMRDEKEEHDVWFIHTIEVSDEEVVELCVDGVYFNFARGIKATASEIEYLTDDIPTDSEVIITNKGVAKVVGIETFAIPKEWWD